MPARVLSLTLALLLYGCACPSLVSDLTITIVLLLAWHYRARAKDWEPRVSARLLSETESWICSSCLSVAARGMCQQISHRNALFKRNVSTDQSQGCTLQVENVNRPVTGMHSASGICQQTSHRDALCKWNMSTDQSQRCTLPVEYVNRSVTGMHSASGICQQTSHRHVLCMRLSREATKRKKTNRSKS